MSSQLTLAAFNATRREAYDTMLATVSNIAEAVSRPEDRESLNAFMDDASRPGRMGVVLWHGSSDLVEFLGRVFDAGYVLVGAPAIRWCPFSHRHYTVLDIGLADHEQFDHPLNMAF